uniref:YqaJ viral recombinase domain-containing protein n=1 Tax=Neogobius melanostomus TaxID=47308 RepID=A0A8C6U5J1_9GOBI
MYIDILQLERHVKKEGRTSPLSKINFSRPKQNAESLTSVAPKYPMTNFYSPEIDNRILYAEINDQDLMQLKSVFPTAAILTSVVGGGSSETDTASETEEEMLSLLEPLTSLYDPTAKTLPPEDVQQRCIGLMHSLQISTTAEALAQLELVTREQAKCQDWHVHRMGRVTGSVLHRVASLQDNTPRLKIVEKIMQYNRKDLDLPALNWGRDMEETARKAYNTAMEQMHTGFTLTHAGLHIKKESPFLGASPDGLVSCTCCGSGVLEVKCPYKYREGLLGCHDDPSFCMDAALELKHTHPYYYQVQLQMYVCGVQFCDFFLWTKAETVYRRITFDKNVLEMPLKKAEQLFIDHILPELLTRHLLLVQTFAFYPW